MNDHSRRLKTRVRTAKKRSAASTRWLARQLNDPLVAAARSAGYRARSVFKLEEIDQKHALIKKGMVVVDLGAAPGSWSQYASQKGAKVVALDLLAIEAIPGVTCLQGDFMAADQDAALLEATGGRIDLVLSDMAADATGRKIVDRLKAEALGEAVLDFARQHVRPGGDCLLKTVRGAETSLRAMAQNFTKQQFLLRPKATRSDSSEIFLLVRGFKPA